MKYLNSIIPGLLLGFLMELFPVTSFSDPIPINPSNQTFLKDSLKKMDSLIKFTLVSNPALSLKYARKAVSFARRLNTAEALIQAYSLMGQTLYTKDQDSSFIFYQRALILSDSAKIVAKKPFLLFRIGSIYYSAKDFNKAIILFDSCAKLADELKEYATMSHALNELGNLNNDIKNRESALKLYDSAFNIATRHSITEEIGLSLGNLARYEKDKGKAYKLNQEAIRNLIKSKGNEEGLARIYINMGNRTNNPDTALFYFKTALKLAIHNNLYVVELGAYNDMVYSYLDKKDIKSAEECLIDHAIPLAQKEKNDDWMASLCDTYAEVLVKKGDFKAAAKWQKTAMDTRISADHAQAAEQVRLLSVLLDLKSKELTIQNNQKEILLDKNRLQKTRLWLTITVFMIIGFVFILLWLQQRNRVKLQIQQIQSAKRIIEIEENEKAKIARELHDITGQLVLGITGEIESLDIPNLKIKEEIKRKIKDLGQSIRLISHRMNKAMLDNFSFEELIQGQCNDIRKAVGLQIQLELPQEPILLNEEEVLHTYRIIQELLTNAGKYAKDSYVSLVIQKTITELSINYTDYGPGFDPVLITKKGMGLMNIFERAKLLKGSAKVTSSPGDGTIWEIKFPLVKGKTKLS